MCPHGPAAHKTPSTALLLVLGSVAALAAASLDAAPLEPGELQPLATTLGVAGAEGGAAASQDSAGSPDTVEMLLRLQQSSATGSERPSMAGVATPVPAGEAPDTAATPATHLKALKSSLFGADSADPSEVGEFAPAGAAGLGSARQAWSRDSGQRSTSPATSGFGEPATTTVRAAGAGAAGGALLANPVVRFIRENRALSIGASLGLLAAVWFTTHYRSRSRRRRRR
ncbi:MAG: hypothetical protein ABS84_14120 [Rubrivivax sp. SCN 71-131]|nr:MAG: hypothetical protein ABS84_14120 [Rubrivivax sp. SCN 71-131]